MTCAPCVQLAFPVCAERSLLFPYNCQHFPMFLLQPRKSVSRLNVGAGTSGSVGPCSHSSAWGALEAPAASLGSPVLTMTERGEAGQGREAGRGRSGRQQSVGTEVDPTIHTPQLPAAPRVQGARGSLWGLRHPSARKGPAGPGAPALRPLPVGTRWAGEDCLLLPTGAGGGVVGSERPGPKILTEGPGCPMGP